MKYSNISKTDMICAENLIKAIAQGRYEFSGLEAMSFVKTCQWFNLTYDEMRKAYEVQEAAKAAKVSEPTVKEPKKKRKASKKAKK